MFDNLNVEIEKKNLSKFNFKFRLPHLKIIKFLIKAIILVFYCKLLKFDKKKSEKNTFFYHFIQINIFMGKKIYLKQKEYL